MSRHALLSASSSHRWLACPPSAKLCEKYEDTGSEYAAEGTAAHTLCEYKLKTSLGISAENPIENLSYYNEEMESCADDYVSYISAVLEKTKEVCSDPIVLIEQRLDFSKYVPKGFGTGDCVIVADDTLTVIDFKYGKGVEVSAEKNPQMLCYALGALELFDCLYDIEKIEMTIFQPRREHVSTYTLSKDGLISWAENVLAPTAKLAFSGEGEFCAGEHCRFCKAKAECRKRAEYNLELAKYDFAMPPTLDNIEISAILERADELISWAGDIKEYALQRALCGETFPGYKVVEGRSNRKYTSEDAVVKKVKEAGFDPYEHKVLGITAMTKLLGKTKFNELLSGLIHKPQGKPVLVPESDKREPINATINDFKEDK